MAGRKVLITGGFGNLGRYAVEACLRRGDHVRVFDRRTRFTEGVAKQFGSASRSGGVEVIWGDLRDCDPVALVAGCDAVIHTAFMLYPATEQQPLLAQAVNVDATRALVKACEGLPEPPRFVFASSVSVFGHTQDDEPPRRVLDPVRPSDNYGRTKVEAEAIVQASTVPWSILRIGLAPPVSPTNGPVKPSRDFFRLLFDVRADNRVEFVHPADAGLALANAAWEPAAAGRILLIGGGLANRVRSIDVTNGIFTAVGLGRFPANVFGTGQLYADWLDSDEAEEILHFRRHTFTGFLTEMKASLGWRRSLLRPFGPIIRRLLVALFSPQGRLAKQ